MGGEFLIEMKDHDLRAQDHMHCHALSYHAKKAFHFLLQIQFDTIANTITLQFDFQIFSYSSCSVFKVGWNFQSLTSFDQESVVI